MKLLYWENTLIEHPMSMFVEITAKKHKVKKMSRKMEADISSSSEKSE